MVWAGYLNRGLGYNCMGSNCIRESAEKLPGS